MKITNGTYLYIIPLGEKYFLSQGYPLIIKEDNNKVFAECPAFGDYGFGDTLEGALKDLGISIIDYWRSLKRRKKLAERLLVILGEMNKNIKETSRIR